MKRKVLKKEGRTYKKIIALFLLYLSSLNTNMLFSTRPFYGLTLEKKLIDPRYGIGRGAPGFKRVRIPRRSTFPVWSQLKLLPTSIVEGLIRMRVDEFDCLLEELQYLV